MLYVQRLATAFFLQTAEASREFDRCFPGQRDRCSALLMWAEEEVEWFAERLDKQVFNSQSAISVVAACVAFLRRPTFQPGYKVLWIMSCVIPQRPFQRIYTCTATYSPIDCFSYIWKLFSETN